MLQTSLTELKQVDRVVWYMFVLTGIEHKFICKYYKLALDFGTFPRLGCCNSGGPVKIEIWHKKS